MIIFSLLLLVKLCLFLPLPLVVQAIDEPFLLAGPQALNLMKLHPTPLLQSTADFPVFTFTQPLDHFDSQYEGETFEQRYWVSTRNYDGSEDAPVIVLDGGETSGARRLPFMDTGIVEHLTKATGGVGVILEHRYYGSSIPVQNFSTDSMRWLTNEQAFEDSANFMRHVDFSAAGINKDMTAPGTKWIYYGGSYAGARAAHMRVLYPDIVYGAISSSGVTAAIYDYWHYLDTVRRALDTKCSENVIGSTKIVDHFLNKGSKSTRQIKTLFGLQDLSLVEDFGATIGWNAYGGWQGKNWDPSLNDGSVEHFCSLLEVAPNPHVAHLPFGHRRRRVEVPITSNETLTVDYALANYAKYINETIVAPYANDVENTFGTTNDAAFLADDLGQTWRCWTFQYCTVWGYLQGAPPRHIPSIMSRRVDPEYNSKICRQSFPPGEYVTIPKKSNVTAVNMYGGFDIAYDRLAIIDGEVDPWMPATPHSIYYAKDRPDTISRPFKLIPGAVHHWDENGFGNIVDEPEFIQKIHYEMIDFVKAWLA